MRKKTRAIYITEGRNDYGAALTASQFPYPHNDPKQDAWLHGWWGAYYKERDRRIDAGELCGHCAQPMDALTTGVFVIGKHGTNKTVCGDCKTDLVQWSDYQVMAQVKSIEAAS